MKCSTWDCLSQLFTPCFWTLSRWPISIYMSDEHSQKNNYMFLTNQCHFTSHLEAVKLLCGQGPCNYILPVYENQCGWSAWWGRDRLYCSSASLLICLKGETWIWRYHLTDLAFLSVISSHKRKMSIFILDSVL